MRKIILLLSLPLMLPSTGLRAQMLADAPIVEAESTTDREAPPRWQASGRLGLVSTTGNTDTTTVNLGLEVIRTTLPWRHRVAAEVLTAEEDGEDTADRWLGEWQSDYRLSERSYIFGALRHESDEFSGFDYQQTAAVGYGRTLIDRERQLLEIEFGPGFRRIKDAITREVESEAIARGLIDYHLGITPSTVFDNRLLVESGPTNTLINNDAAVKVAINDRFALSVGVQVRHNTDAPVGTEETDTTTTASVVYSLN